MHTRHPNAANYLTVGHNRDAALDQRHPRTVKYSIRLLMEFEFDDGANGESIIGRSHR